MDTHEKNSKDILNNGNPRNKGGRPKGSLNKISLTKFLSQMDTTLGQSLMAQICENYKAALAAGDRQMVLAYDRIWANKLFADRLDVEVNTTEDQVESKAQAFREAIEHMKAQDEQRNHLH